MLTTDCCKVLWNKLPEGVVALFLIQIFSTFSFSVLYSTLVLYMTGALALTASMANSTMGVFVAFNFALHLLGGYLGGRFFSYRALFCIGMIAQIIGCSLLATVNPQLLYYGLAAFLTGSGLHVTCLNCMLTQRFSPEDTRREGAFLYNYAGMNIGFFAGFTLSGYFQLLHNYRSLFLWASIGNLIALLVSLCFWRSLKDMNTTYITMNKNKQTKSFVIGLLAIASISVVLSQFLFYANFSNQLILITGLGILFVIYKLAMQQPTQDARDKIIAFAVLMVVGTVFWTLYQIGPMGMTQFINHNVQRNWSGLTIPPQWFQNINTICIVVGGPLFSFIFSRVRAKGGQINIPVQFSFSLFLIGMAFVLLPVGILNADSNGLVAPEWIIASFVLQSAGELLISPIGYAMIGALAPTSLQGIMMGMWMFSTGVGATLSSYSSNWMTMGQDSSNPLLTNGGYSQVFLYLGLTAIIAGFGLSLLSSIIKRWMTGGQVSNQPDVALKSVCL